VRATPNVLFCRPGAAAPFIGWPGGSLRSDLLRLRTAGEAQARVETTTHNRSMEPGEERCFVDTDAR
jgi:hypothetical protein